MSQNRIEKPKWLKVKAPTRAAYQNISTMVKDLKLATVCQEALCPNMGECWSGQHKTATFMLMGEVCTRACKFCAVKTGNPRGLLDQQEPEKISEAVKSLGLSYVVLTSVDRDDLPDGGADHFAKTVRRLKADHPNLLVEILTPDFLAKKDLIKVVVEAAPDVFAHNIEVVESLSKKIRDRRADYAQSLRTLQIVKRLNPSMLTKSSLMVGVSETKEEMIQAMKDLRSVGCDLLTVGQYLPPTEKHYPLSEYVDPDLFQFYEEEGLKLGFKYVASGPLVRSSYKAGELFVTRLLKGETCKS